MFKNVAILIDNKLYATYNGTTGPDRLCRNICAFYS